MLVATISKWWIAPILCIERVFVFSAFLDRQAVRAWPSSNAVQLQRLCFKKQCNDTTISTDIAKLSIFFKFLLLLLFFFLNDTSTQESLFRARGFGGGFGAPVGFGPVVAANGALAFHQANVNGTNATTSDY